MSKVCPECGREFSSSSTSVRCPICKCALVESPTIDNSAQARNERLKQLQQQRMQVKNVPPQQIYNQPVQANPISSTKKIVPKKGMPMTTWKLVSGIISIILFIIVSFQSCAAGLGNAISNNGEVSGSAGALVSVMLLAGGIVSICVRKGGKGGNIAIIVLYGIGTLFGFLLAGSFSDLYIWSFWCLVCTVLAIISLTKS